MLIRELRRSKCISQEQLAEMCGLSLRTIQRVEGGHRIGHASLNALAAVFEINVDTLEQELYTMEKSSSEYTELPLWIRLYIGNVWYAASRKEFQKSELFFIFLAIIFGITWAFLSSTETDGLPVKISTLGFLCTFVGAYNISITIRVGDKYDIWSRLDSTLPSGIHGFFKLLVASIIISVLLGSLIFVFLFGGV